MNSLKMFLFLISTLLLCFGCKTSTQKDSMKTVMDPHSFSNPSITKVKHLDLDLKINFENKRIEGLASYTLEADHGSELILDNLGLIIQSIQIESGGSLTEAHYHIDTIDPVLGAGIHIELKAKTEKVRIQYRSGQNAYALQWLPKEQTRRKKYPFLFTQSQSIYARSWIPCPDGPGIRFTYHAKVSAPKDLMVVMSATNSMQRTSDGIYEFDMEIPIPAYLLALAVGDFDFKAIGNRTGVYAEPGLLDKAAAEFSDLENMLITAENLYGPYPWKRYDVIVLPASFPFGGMENPRITFLTPSVIAGDQSLTSLLAHELAHSWSGNLVTNASWNDFWLNEGFTTYFESRIMEALYGKPYADMLSSLGFQDLNKTMHEMGTENPLSKLKLNLQGMDPEEALTDIAYEKGKLLLRFLEERTGRAAFDQFLKNYFEYFKYKSNTSEGFLKFAVEHLIKQDTSLLDTVKKWIYEPGLISFTPAYDTLRFKNIDQSLVLFLKTMNPKSLHSDAWTTHEWIYFIRKLPSDKNIQRCLILNSTFKLSTARNSEIKCAWFEYALKNNFGKQILPDIQNFLIQNGRRKYLMPIYTAMLDNALNKEAWIIFEMAKSGYHPISLNSVQKLLIEKI